jgi:hypothetical protein
MLPKYLKGVDLYLKFSYNGHIETNIDSDSYEGWKGQIHLGTIQGRETHLCNKFI